MPCDSQQIGLGHSRDVWNFWVVGVLMAMSWIWAVGGRGVEPSQAGVEESVREKALGALLTKHAVPEWLRPTLQEQHAYDVAQIEELVISHPRVGDQDLAVLSQFVRLKHLTLLAYESTGSRLTDAAVAHIAALPCLERLDVGMDTLTGEGFAYLKGAIYLKGLKISDWSPTERGMACIADLQTLEDLSLEVRYAPDGAIRHLKRLNHLKRLSLWQVRQTDKNLAAILAFTGPQSLELSFKTDDKSLQEPILEQIAGMLNITGLWLGYSGITDSGLASLRRLVNLRNLNLADTPVSDAGLSCVAVFKQLRRLQVNETSIGDLGLAHIAALSEIEELDLSDTKVTDAGLAALRGLSKLKILKLVKTRVTGAGMRHLAGLLALEELDLTGTEVDDEGISHLRGLKRMRLLDLRGTRVTNAGMANLRGMEGLRELKLSESCPGSNVEISEDAVKRELANLKQVVIYVFGPKFEQRAAGGAGMKPYVPDNPRDPQPTHWHAP